MKTIIISDIKGKSESIIPYGLNLAKNLESEVDILHIIDSRSLHGVQSAYSDSQTIAPGNKMSHQEIVDREKKHAEMELDRILSKEASKLNYPLKINTVIEVGSIESKIKTQVKSSKDCLLLINSAYDDFIFHSSDEILDTISNMETVSLLVPPGHDFVELKNIFLISNPEPKKLSKIRDQISFLEKFKPVISSINVVKPKNYEKKKLKSNSLEDMMKDRFTPFKFNVKTLSGNKYTEVLMDYIKKSKPDLMMNLLQRKSLFNSLLQKSRNGKLIKDTTVPVLLIK